MKVRDWVVGDVGGGGRATGGIVYYFSLFSHKYLILIFVKKKIAFSMSNLKISKIHLYMSCTRFMSTIFMGHLLLDECGHRANFGGTLARQKKSEMTLEKLVNFEGQKC